MIKFIMYYFWLLTYNDASNDPYVTELTRRFCRRKMNRNRTIFNQ